MIDDMESTFPEFEASQELLAAPPNCCAQHGDKR